METIFNLNISQTGYQPDQVFVAVLGNNTTEKNGLPVATSNFCYLDFKKGTLVNASLSGGQLPKKMITSLASFPKQKVEPLLNAEEKGGSDSSKK